VRAVHDEQLRVEVARVHKENYQVYGVRKVHAQLVREGVLGASGQRPVARCTTRRAMKDLGLRGISRAKGPRTTVPGTGPDTRPDLVERAFTAQAPDRLWVADITYCRTYAGWVYAAFILDVCSRRVVGWQLSSSLRTDLALDALNMGLWTRQHNGHDTSALVHHSDRGVQGGLNWPSQHLDREVEDGALRPEAEEGPGLSRSDPLAGTADSGLASGPGAVLGRHRPWCLDGRGSCRGRRVVARRLPLVSSRWRGEADAPAGGVRPLSVVR